MTDTDDLEAAERAFDRGDFREVRALAGRLRSSLDPDVRKRALALRERVSVDPVAVVVWVLSFAFFAFVAASYLGGK